MMTETIYCPAQTRAARMYDDPEPAEFCENEVADYGDLCSEHDVPDDDDFCHERYLDAKYEREHDPDYYTDFGD